MISAGSVLPSVKVHENAPNKAIDIREVFGQDKGILIGVPGAFTPGCHMTHIPSYVKDFDSLKAAGVKNVAVVAVNDVFVMNAWGEALKTQGKIRMLADPTGALVKSMGLDFDGLKEVLGNTRSKRFSAVIEGGKVKHIDVEPDNTGLSCTLASNIKKHL
jgi:2-Cys peroxiredoxin 5